MRAKEKKGGAYILFALFCFCFGLMAGRLHVSAGEVISIDANRRYQGMNASFAKGYTPSVRKGEMELVVPFQTDLPLKEDCLSVKILFEREENSPFQFKNYWKKVKRGKRGVYLYRCKVKLKKDRVNGQYPLRLVVSAQTAGETVEQEFTVYAEITDGRVFTPPEEGVDIKKEEQWEMETDSLDKKAQAEKKRQKPKVRIEGNSLNGEFLMAGESAAWRLMAKNCSESQGIWNLKVTLLSEDADLVFTKTSWYFPQVKAGGVMDLSQNISLGGKTAKETAVAQFLFDYEDEGGENCQMTETVTLRIARKQKAELTNVSFPKSVYEGDTETFSFQAANVGLSVIYNAKVRFEGRGLFAAKEIFLGNLEAGEAKEGEIPVFAGTLDMEDGIQDEPGQSGDQTGEHGEKYGKTLGVAVFTFENEQGEVTEQRQEIMTAVQKPEIVELKVQEEAPETNQWWVTVFVLVILGLLAVILWLIARGRRK